MRVRILQINKLYLSMGSSTENRNQTHGKRNGLTYVHCMMEQYIQYINNKAVPLQAWSGPEGSRKLRFPDFMTTAQDGGKVVSLTHRPPLPPRKYTWYSFLLEAESTPGP